MIVLGLTGGIGMGKSTASGTFRRLGVPVFDADAAVHRLQARGGRAVGPIGAAFPGTVVDGRVDREALRRAVLGKPEALKVLERIVHPLVRSEEERFLAAARRAGRRIVVLDVPLLLETGGEKRVDRERRQPRAQRRVGRVGVAAAVGLPQGFERLRARAAGVGVGRKVQRHGSLRVRPAMHPGWAYGRLARHGGGRQGRAMRQRSHSRPP